MLKIRLQRVGRKHDPSYRVILTDARQGPKSGKFIENLGFYDARRNVRQVKGDRIKHWISNGAQASDTVHNILIKEQIIMGKKINVLSKRNTGKKKDEGEKLAENKTAEIIEATEEIKSENKPIDKEIPATEKNMPADGEKKKEIEKNEATKPTPTVDELVKDKSSEKTTEEEK